MKANKFRAFFPTGDGSYMSKELPGPSNYQQWLMSWTVFRNAMIMLGLASLAALATHERCTEKLCCRVAGSMALDSHGGRESKTREVVKDEEMPHFGQVPRSSGPYRLRPKVLESKFCIIETAVEASESNIRRHIRDAPSEIDVRCQAACFEIISTRPTKKATRQVGALRCSES